MDYFVLSSLSQNTPARIAISYDIACQWSRNLWRRIQIYPMHLQPHQHPPDIQFFIPKFHLAAHQQSCYATYSFNTRPLVGRTDGEAPERGWAAMNPVAASTKEMGPGSRRNTLDNHFGDYNWRKVAALGCCLLCMP